MDFSNQRRSYDKDTLVESVLPEQPFDLFEQWMSDALAHDVAEPYAMSLATCGADNMPAVRTVLMREITQNGVVFYTNYLSAKGLDIAQNPNAEVLFFWPDMQRQIRIRGIVTKIARDKTEAYFQKRPYESQIGAWVSQPQSGVVGSRVEMDKRFAELVTKYPADTLVPTPDFWGGYLLTASEIEFWQGRPSRLHDRILYKQDGGPSNQLGSQAVQASTQQSAQLPAQWTYQRLLP